MFAVLVRGGKVQVAGLHGGDSRARLLFLSVCWGGRSIPGGECLTALQISRTGGIVCTVLSPHLLGRVPLVFGGRF